MRAYLSSFRLGDHPDELVRLMSGRRRIAVIANAIDGAPPPDRPPNARALGVDAECVSLRELGLEPKELDLRDYFGEAGTDVSAALASYDALWLRGGNVFLLRAALALSGADRAIVDLLAADRVVYAGYSAGPAVLGPSLRGLELVDPVDAVEPTYGVAPRWDGLGVLDYAVVPHFESPGHPETEDIGRLAARYRADGTPHRTLHDGAAIVIDGDDQRLV